MHGVGKVLKAIVRLMASFKATNFLNFGLHVSIGFTLLLKPVEIVTLSFALI
jgi:hypothetical protein